MQILIVQSYIDQVNPRLWKRWRLYIFPVMHCGSKSLKNKRKAGSRFVYSAKISHHQVILCHTYSVFFN